MITLQKQGNNIIKAGTWYAFANILIALVVFVTTPIFTRLMDKSEFGMFQTYLSIVGVMTPFITLNIEATLINGKYDYKYKYNEFVSSLIMLDVVAAIIWGFIIIVFLDFDGLFGFNIYYLMFMIVYIVSFEVNVIYRIQERNYYRYKNAIRLSVLLAISSAILSIYLVAFMEDKLLARIAGYIIPTIIVGMVLWFIFFRNGGGVSIQYWKYSLPICLPFIPHIFSMTALNSIDKIMIMKYCGSEFTALYSIAYMCGRMSALISDSMNSAYVPFLADDLMKHNYSSIRKDSCIYIMIFSFIYLGMLLMAPEILFFLGGDSYMGALYVIVPVLIGGFYQFLYTLYVNIEQIMKQTKWLPIASMFAAILNYILNLLFIPRFGYLAAAYTTSIGYASLLLAHMFLVWRMGFGNVYNYKLVFGITGGMTVFSFAISSLYRMPLIRLVFFLMYLLGGAYAIYNQWEKRDELANGISIKFIDFK